MSRDDYDDYEDEPREWRPQRRGYECPFCGSTEPPATRKEISVGGWIVFAVMLLFCFPLFWIGFLIKDEKYFCYDCRRKIGS